MVMLFKKKKNSLKIVSHVSESNNFFNFLFFYFHYKLPPTTPEFSRLVQTLWNLAPIQSWVLLPRSQVAELVAGSPKLG